MRGENDKSDALVCAIAWYTPHAWGNGFHIQHEAVIRGHPHMRGENATL